MNKIKSIILDQTNWLEVNIENEEGTIIHCESFGDSDEYQELLKQRCNEFETTLHEEQLDILKKQKANRYVPTDEEISEQNRQNRVRDLENQIQEVKAYLSNTGWYVERLNDPSSSKAIPEEVLTKRAKARELINTLEAELVTIGAK